MMLKLFLLIACSILLVGCSAGPYEPQDRAGQGPDYSKYVFAMYDDPRGGATTLLRPALPMVVAVAEVGELGPDEKVIATLRAQPEVFRRVQTISGISDGDFYSDPYRNDSPKTGGCAAAGNPRVALSRLQRLARDTGADYLLIMGATVDAQAHATPLSALDLTIIGAFIAPSEQLTAQAQASAALIDLRADRIVLTSSGSARDSSMTPSVAVAGGHDQQIRSVRDAVYQRLAKQLVDDCRNRAGLPAATQKNP